jgi:hypothetical protein
VALAENKITEKSTPTHKKPTTFQRNVFSVGIQRILAAFYCIRTYAWVLAAKVSAILPSNPL